MRILHVGPPSPFVDFLVGYFERAAPGQNVVVTTPRATSGGALGLARAALGYARHLAAVARAARRADVVVAHMLSLPTAVALVSARRRAFTVWSGWGADYYDEGSTDARTLLGPLTREAVERLGLDRAPRGGAPVRRLTQGLVARAARRADAFSAPIPDDLDVVRERHPDFTGTYLQLNYADLSSFDVGPEVSGRDILLGNSAYPANNHLEALEWLSRFDLTGRKVLVPLAYGDPAYRALVEAEGHRLLGEAFDPLLQPLPFEAFAERVGRCSVVVMNHYRQQALGTIGIGLAAGATVYLATRNPLYGFLHRSGLDVHAVESADDLPTGAVPAPVRERRHEVLAGIWGPDVVQRNVEHLLEVARARTAR
ncbi:MAG: TDP-N-acetylfucosamine:lipid II N-acetylfucosaminyltransferase [Angustibacter sp.]